MSLYWKSTSVANATIEREFRELIIRENKYLKEQVLLLQAAVADLYERISTREKQS